MADTFSISPESQVGNVFLTEFVFKSTTDLATAFAWEFGDGVVSYDGPTTSHIYQYPGTYTVSSSAWLGDDTAPYVSQTSISASYVLSNEIYFTQIPSEYSVPGQKTQTPFTVSLTSTEIYDSLYLVLQSLNTDSTPIAYVPSKWQSITPKWQFVDADTNQTVTDGLLVKTSPIYRNYNGTSRVVAVSGSASFYYIDDLSTRFDSATSCPVLLIATLSTENFVNPPDSPIYPYNSYANNDSAKTAVLWQIKDFIPTSLKVTENYISDVYPIKWTNVPIPAMVTCSFDSSLNSNYSGVTPLTATILGYPRTNEVGSVYPVSLTLQGGSYANQQGNPPYFTNKDSDGNVNSGYVYTSITPQVSSSLPTTVVAETTCVEPLAVSVSGVFTFPYNYPIYSNAYVCCPYTSVINNFSLVNCPSANSFITFYRNLGALTDGRLDLLTLTSSTSTENTTTQLLCSAPLYGISVDPVLNVVYATDPINGKLYSFDRDNNLDQERDLNYVLANVLPQSLEGEIIYPCALSIDSKHNVWISLYNEETIVKFNSSLNYVCSAEPSTYIEEVQLLTPPIIETDSDDNVWACYAEIDNSYLVKYDENGNELLNISLSSYADSLPVPVSLAIDADSSVWVGCYNTNQLIRFLTDGTFVASVSGGFTRPNYLAADRSNNIWFTHGYNFIGKYNSLDETMSSWQVSTSSVSSIVASETDAPTVDMWGGLAVDVYNRVWSIDSEFGNVAVFPVQDPTTLRVLNAQPSLSTISISLPIPVSGADIPTSHIRSSQAVGDWTGNKWYQKYSVPVSAIPVFGNSTEFNVFNLDGTYSVAKVNEEFDISAYFKSLALPESLSQNTIFFDSFLAAVAGDGNPTTESAGRIIYERIANFVQTHGDFETSEIDQLLSYAKQLSVDAKTYGIEFPSEISRLLNIFSVPKKALRGRVNYNPDITNNIGSLITETDEISADQYLFARDKKYNNYSLIHVTPLEYDTTNTPPTSALVYPLSLLDVPGFRIPLTDNYYFFQYNQEPEQPINENGQYIIPSTSYVENIINWDSAFTTFDYTLSTNEEWYGDNGLVETMFNNILTKRLLG